MERGLPSDKKHLDAGRYKAAALAAREEALEARIGELEEERKEKAREADRENGRAILRGVANVFGKGKYTEIEKENARLRDELDEEAAEKEKLAAANKKLKAEKEKLKADIPSAEEKGRRQGKQEGKVAVDSLRRELEDAYKQFKEAYEKAYRLPEGVEEDAVRIGKYADGRWKVSADLGDAGRTSRRDLSPADCAAYFRERVITKAQLAAKYLGTEMKSLLEGFRNRAALVAGKRQAARVRQPDGRRP